MGTIISVPFFQVKKLRLRLLARIVGNYDLNSSLILLLTSLGSKGEETGSFI